MGRAIFAGLLVGALLALATGCGGGGGSSTGSTGGGGSSSSNLASSGKASAQFLREDGSNKFFVEFGEEAPAAEREAASAVLDKNLSARESRNFAAQCATLNRKTIEEIAIGSTADAEAVCPTELEAMAKPFAKTKATRKDTFDPPIAALRVKGNRAYALFHGTNGTNYAFAMEKEDGQWKVGALLANEI